MNDDIRYWRGKRIDHLTMDELRQALAEVYRELEQQTWLAHQRKLAIERDGKKPGRPRKIVEAVDEVELADAA